MVYDGTAETALEHANINSDQTGRKGGGDIEALIIGAVLAAIIIWAVVASNRLKVMLVRIEESAFEISESLSKLYGTLCEFSEIVETCAADEAGGIVLVEPRPDMELSQKAELAGLLALAGDRFRAVAGESPALRSSERARTLQDAVLDAEDKVLAAKRAYNENVSDFNRTIVQFPYNAIAGLRRYSPREFFSEEKRNHTT